MLLIVDPVISFVSALAVGVLTAIASVQLALRRFRAERWWERKAEAYSILLGALFDVQRSLQFEISRIEEGTDLSESYLKDLKDRSRAGYVEIRKAAVIGSFLFGSESAARINVLVNKLDDPKHNLDFHEEVGEDFDAVTSALRDLKELAKNDLAVR
jgi:hypothetical protein